MIYRPGTDQAMAFIEKYSQSGHMTSPYSREQMASLESSRDFDPEMVDLYLTENPDCEGHLLVLDVSQGEPVMWRELSELFPGLGRWHDSLENQPGTRPELVIFNLATQQALAVALGSDRTVHIFEAIKQCYLELPGKNKPKSAANFESDGQMSLFTAMDYADIVQSMLGKLNIN